MSGFSGKSLCSATITQSAGVPSMAHSCSAILLQTMGCRSVSDCAVPLCSRLGATMLTVANPSSAAASARNPSAWYPSSFVRRMCVIGNRIPVLVFQDNRTTRSPPAEARGSSSLSEEEMVGTTGFEPATSRTPSVRATRLRYVPTGKLTATGQRKSEGRIGEAISTSKVSPPFEQRQESAQRIAQIEQHFAAQKLRRSVSTMARGDVLSLEISFMLSEKAARARDGESFVVEQPPD